MMVTARPGHSYTCFNDAPIIGCGGRAYLLRRNAYNELRYGSYTFR